MLVNHHHSKLILHLCSIRPLYSIAFRFVNPKVPGGLPPIPPIRPIRPIPPIPPIPPNTTSPQTPSTEATPIKPKYPKKDELKFISKAEDAAKKQRDYIVATAYEKQKALKEAHDASQASNTTQITHGTTSVNDNSDADAIPISSFILPPISNQIPDSTRQPFGITQGNNNAVPSTSSNKGQQAVKCAINASLFPLRSASSGIPVPPPLPPTIKSIPTEPIKCQSTHNDIVTDAQRRQTSLKSQEAFHHLDQRLEDKAVKALSSHTAIPVPPPLPPTNESTPTEPIPFKSTHNDIVTDALRRQVSPTALDAFLRLDNMLNTLRQFYILYLDNKMPEERLRAEFQKAADEYSKSSTSTTKVEISADFKANFKFSLGLINSEAIDPSTTIFLSPLHKHATILYITNDNRIIILGYLTSTKNENVVSDKQVFDKKSGKIQYMCILDKPMVVDKHYLKDLPDEFKQMGEDFSNDPAMINKLKEFFTEKLILASTEDIPVYNGIGITLEGLEASFHQHTLDSQDLANKWFIEYKAKKGQDILQNDFVININAKVKRTNPLALEIFNKLVEDEKAKYT